MHDDTTGGAPLVTVHHTAPPAGTVISPERDVRTGRPGSHDREDKNRRRRDDPGRHPAATPTPRFRPRARFVVGALAAGALVTAGVVALGSPDEDRPGDTTIAVAATSPGVADTPAPSLPPGVTATTTGAPGATSPAVPPPLDPGRIFGYEVTFTRTLVEVAPTVEIPASEAVGAVSNSASLCMGGTCSLGEWTFPAGAETFSDSSELTDPENHCYPITISLELDRDDDGTYSGTWAFDPAEVFAEWQEGTVSHSCTIPRTVDELTLVPLVMLDPGETADPSLPAELDPLRIAGYTGGIVEDGQGRGVEVSCRGGYCSLNCSPLCSGILVFEAAAEEWVADSSPFQICGPGSTSLRLVRGPDGSYSGSATATYEGEPGPECSTEMEITLAPLVAEG